LGSRKLRKGLRGTKLMCVGKKMLEKIRLRKVNKGIGNGGSQRKSDRVTERQRGHGQRDRETKRHRDSQRQAERNRYTEIYTERTDRDRQREKARERETVRGRGRRKERWKDRRKDRRERQTGEKTASWKVGRQVFLPSLISLRSLGSREGRTWCRFRSNPGYKSSSNGLKEERKEGGNGDE
jgi:hypothetical protein